MPAFDFPKMEEEILAKWDQEKTFEKSVSQRPAGKPYVFYDGPPFATGLPHYGHIVASLLKDVVPRYWTMKGYRVERRWGWDCHGLPIENLIEKELGLVSKKDIEDHGVEKFCESCRATVLKYASEWKKVIHRLGRWVDMERDYKTMDPEYMESLWAVFKTLHERGLVYEGKKSMHICTRCETPLSNFEVTQNYKDVEDTAVVVKFKIIDRSSVRARGVSSRDLGRNGRGSETPLRPPSTTAQFFLAWTTTPWTLPGNVLLAVNPDIEYVAIAQDDAWFWVAKDRAIYIFGTKDGTPPKPVATALGAELIGAQYEPLFPYFADTPNAFRVVAGDFVTVTDGTGIVHIAPAFGEDDFQIGQREKIPLVQHVLPNGHFVSAVSDFKGLPVKPQKNPPVTDEKIIVYLKEREKIFSSEKYSHSYPHCWRCDTPLLNYLTSSWFIKVTAIKNKMLAANKKINWVPTHIKEGRFGKWLEDARDWAVSRSRYWGTPLPVWRAEDGEIIVIGSREELEKLSGQEIDDLHKHIVDKILIERDGKIFRRVPEVLDCWFESGGMPYAERHWPFGDKKKFSREFPAQFIAEGQDQTRGWFYTLTVLGAALFDQPAFLNVIVNGIVLSEDGAKMSKRLKNYPDPMDVIGKLGADALRYYLLTSPVMAAENLNFSEKGVQEVQRKTLMILWNVVEFYKLYGAGFEASGANGGRRGNSDPRPFRPRSRDELPRVPTAHPSNSTNILDEWIIARLNNLIKEVTTAMEAYQLQDAARPISAFITDLSIWYVRRSRSRFKSDDVPEKNQAQETLRHILLTLARILAPFTPFIAEKIHVELGGESESVHLTEWPTHNKKLINETLLKEMQKVREICSAGLEARARASIPVRQILGKLTVVGGEIKDRRLIDLIKDEVNIEEVEISDGGLQSKVTLDTKITPALKEKGQVREIIRFVNNLRKDHDLTIKDTVVVNFWTDDAALKNFIERNEAVIKKATLASEYALAKSRKAEAAALSNDLPIYFWI
ncbi:MAG: ileS [Candidatus Magasanikbacteria bacterium]|nr:ileS [Candidatus Magasanikbacteria bacterium]